MRGDAVRSHEDLDVWKVAMEVAVRVYAETAKLPSTEAFGLQQQMRRAAVSVPSNIAEGAARQSTREFLKFISIAMGSLAELDTQLLLCDRLKLLPRCAELRQEVRRNRLLFSRLSSSLRSRVRER